MHTHTHARTHTHAHTHTQHTHTPVAYQGNETEETVFKKRKVFKEDLKELTLNSKNVLLDMLCNFFFFC